MERPPEGHVAFEERIVVIFPTEVAVVQENAGVAELFGGGSRPIP